MDLYSVPEPIFCFASWIRILNYFVRIQIRLNKQTNFKKPWFLLFSDLVFFIFEDWCVNLLTESNQLTLKDLRPCKYKIA